MKTLLLLTALLSSAGLGAQNPTWADDIACIVYSHCSPCHHPGGAAPFSLMTYAEASAYGSSIRYSVEHREMPPWPVDNAYRKFAHNRSLSDQERASVLRWIGNGMPQGNIANTPAAPVFTTSLQIPQPDLRLQMPFYTLPSISDDLYRCFVLPTGIAQQKYITGMEIVPGNKEIVHHVQVFYDTTGVCQSLDDASPGPGYTSAGGVGSNNAVLLGTWVPGASPVFVPAGMGKRLPANARIVMQVHYPSYASGRSDSTKVHFLFTSATVRNILDAPVLNHINTIKNGPLFIPKNTVRTFYEEFTVPINATLISVGPHAHLICRSLKAWGISPLGDTIPIIHIPQWDFHWQGFYDFTRPLKIPAGTRLVGEAVYDNTADNEHNPSDPPQDVSAGEATTDEMMLFYFSFLPYRSGDELIVVDTSSHKAHHLDCVSADRTPLSLQGFQQIQWKVFPNPSRGGIRIETEETRPYTVEWLDPYGKLLFSRDQAETIPTEAYPAGLYLLRIRSGDQVYSEKIVLE